MLPESCNMPNVLIKFSDIKHLNQSRPLRCPYCNSPILQGWGNATRNVHDTQFRTTEIPRYRCSHCKRTFRYYPAGMDRASFSHRIKHLAALIYALGMSSRDVVEIFQEQGIEISHTLVWRGGNELAEHLKGEKDGNILRRYSLDRVYVPRISQRLGVVVAIDLGLGKRTVIGTVNESDPRVVKSWLESTLKDAYIDISILGTDIFEQYRSSDS